MVSCDFSCVHRIPKKVPFGSNHVLEETLNLIRVAVIKSLTFVKNMARTP
jgi:hypothetical protein